MSCRSDVMAAMSSSSAGKPAMDSSSAAKPAMDCLVAFYNINWDKGRFEEPEKHELSLAADILTALDEFSVDVLLLSDCGEVGIGLDPKQWLPMIRRICRPQLCCDTSEPLHEHRQESHDGGHEAAFAAGASHDFAQSRVPDVPASAGGCKR